MNGKTEPSKQTIQRLVSQDSPSLEGLGFRAYREYRAYRVYRVYRAYRV